jgi:hypothetical protein
MSVEEFVKGKFGCVLCYHPPQYKCKQCRKYYCYICGPKDQSHTSSGHKIDKEMITPPVDRLDFTDYNECKTCCVNLPTSLTQCYCCKGREFQPYKPKVEPDLTPEEKAKASARVKRLLDSEPQFSWVCEWCYTFNQPGVELCKNCQKGENEPYFDDQVIAAARRKMESLENSKLIQTIKKISTNKNVKYPFEVAFRIDPHFLPESDKEFIQGLKLAYEQFDKTNGEDSNYSKEEFLYSLHKSGDLRPAIACRIHRTQVRSTLGCLPQSLLTVNIVQKVVDKGAYSFKDLFQGETLSILREIGALDEPTDNNKKINEYFSGDLSAEDKSVIAKVIKNELIGQPNCDTLIALTNNWEDYGDIKLGDMQIVINKTNGNLGQCQQMVKYVCGMCKDSIPEFRLYTASSCNCKVDKVCFHDHIQRLITRVPAAQWKCGACGQPKKILDGGDSSLQELFNAWRKYINENPGTLDKSEINLFEDKIRQYKLSKTPGAVSCKNCKYIWIEKDLMKNKCLCPNCKNDYCRVCMEMWTDEHNDQTCEFMFRKALGNMDIRIIRCPGCSTFVEEVLGHCQHFDCQNCPTKFCPCGVKFFDGKECELYHEQCAVLGLHGHHPRNCYTYLRNMDVDELKKLIIMNNKRFEPQNSSGDKCSIKLDLNDEFCTKPHLAYGLCLDHFKFHMSTVIQEHKMDPLDVLNIKDISILYRNLGLTVPPQDGKEQDPTYRERLATILKSKWVLDSAVL